MSQMQHKYLKKFPESGKNCLYILLYLIGYKEYAREYENPPTMEELFKTDHISVDKLVLIEGVVLTGYVWQAPLKRNKAAIYLKKDALIWCRANHIKKEVVDIEYKDAVEYKTATISWDMYKKLLPSTRKS